MIWVAKTLDGRFFQIKRFGRVAFDPRPGWLLVFPRIGARPRRQLVRWIHPADVPLEWVRPFRFLGVTV